MRLIDADALMDDINELKKSPWYNSDINGSRVVRSEAIDIVQRLCIDDAPTIDAVEVVRCKDRRYWAYDCEGGFGIKYGRCSRWADAWGEHEPETTDRDYCSYADRKTEPTHGKMTYREAWETIYFKHCQETCDYAYMDNCQEEKCEYYMALQALNRQYYSECGSVWVKPKADRKTEPQTERSE